MLRNISRFLPASQKVNTYNNIFRISTSYRFKQTSSKRESEQFIREHFKNKNLIVRQDLIYYYEYLNVSLKKRPDPTMPIISYLTGHEGVGKTTFTTMISDVLKSKGWSVVRVPDCREWYKLPLEKASQYILQIFQDQLPDEILQTNVLSEDAKAHEFQTVNQIIQKGIENELFAEQAVYLLMTEISEFEKHPILLIFDNHEVLFEEHPQEKLEYIFLPPFNIASSNMTMKRGALLLCGKLSDSLARVIEDGAFGPIINLGPLTKAEYEEWMKTQQYLNSEAVHLSNMVVGPLTYLHQEGVSFDEFKAQQTKKYNEILDEFSKDFQLHIVSNVYAMLYNSLISATEPYPIKLHKSIIKPLMDDGLGFYKNETFKIINPIAEEAVFEHLKKNIRNILIEKLSPRTADILNALVGKDISYIDRKISFVRELFVRILESSESTPFNITLQSLHDSENKILSIKDGENITLKDMKNVFYDDVSDLIIHTKEYGTLYFKIATPKLEKLFTDEYLEAVKQNNGTIVIVTWIKEKEMAPREFKEWSKQMKNFKNAYVSFAKDVFEKYEDLVSIRFTPTAEEMKEYIEPEFTHERLKEIEEALREDFKVAKIGDETLRKALDDLLNDAKENKEE